jgi:hypothetical protein
MTEPRTLTQKWSPLVTARRNSRPTNDAIPRYPTEVHPRARVARALPPPAELVREVEAHSARTGTPLRETADLPYPLTAQRLTCDGRIIVSSQLNGSKQVARDGGLIGTIRTSGWLVITCYLLMGYDVTVD